MAIAATVDAAIVQANDYSQRTRLGRLVELSATGEAGRRLDRHPLGTVIADPNGHVAFWTSRRPDGPHLVALDTSTGAKVVGPAVGSGSTGVRGGGLDGVRRAGGLEGRIP